MQRQHPQEKIVHSFDYNGIAVDLLEWTATIWCGKIGFAVDNTGEPNVERIIRDFQTLNTSAVNEREGDWEVCMSVNYLSPERPNGVMFGFLVGMERQPEVFDIVRVPAALYMRIPMCDKTAKALDSEPWRGGIPPYAWIGEQVAPTFGYRYGDAALPIFEYYGHYNAEQRAHEFSYLYVPVEKA